MRQRNGNYACLLLELMEGAMVHAQPYALRETLRISQVTTILEHSGVLRSFRLGPGKEKRAASGVDTTDRTVLVSTTTDGDLERVECRSSETVNYDRATMKSTGTSG